MRLFSKGGHDWTSRYPWIVESARKNRQTQFIIDGKAVVLGVDGISDFNALHSTATRHEEVEASGSEPLAFGFGLSARNRSRKSGAAAFQTQSQMLHAVTAQLNER